MTDTGNEQYCVDLVRRLDEHRWLAVQYVAPELRRKLIALYALHWEIRQIPSVVSEPPLGEIRLQWWREALDEILAGGRVRAHPVVQLAQKTQIITERTRPVFETAIDSRAPLLYKDPFKDETALWAWLDEAEGYLAHIRVNLRSVPDERLDQAPLIRAESAFSFALQFAGVSGDLIAKGAMESASKKIDAALLHSRTLFKSMEADQSALHLHLALTDMRKRNRQNPFTPLLARLKLFQAMAFGAF